MHSLPVLWHPVAMIASTSDASGETVTALYSGLYNETEATVRPNLVTALGHT